jgi:hypothetical protein
MHACWGGVLVNAENSNTKKKKKRLEKKEHRGDGREDEMKAVLRWAG